VEIVVAMVLLDDMLSGDKRHGKWKVDHEDS
jgi:hypothetical protein